MARRRKTGADDLMDLVALLPWWAGLGLAVLSYLVLHALATAPVPLAQSAQDMGQVAVRGLWRGLAYAGQFILPFLCAMGALASVLRRRRRRTLLNTVSQSKAADALEGMTWQAFELLVGEAFRQQGYTVQERGGGGADGGIDLVLGKAGEKVFVQCKQWKAFKVGVTVVRELYGVMAAGGAAGGVVVTSGRFTQEATAFAEGRNIRLVDGPALLQWIRQGRAAPGHSDRPLKSEAAPAFASVHDAPACPVCAQSMVRRVAKRGASAGRAFWGCEAYPGCKGTRSIDGA
ncbi:restriction endonuclease [Variovorax boronicumulans]|uniref:restriction endonuclease n=1 Tax=Variovorax boronicumulans TaxID=436515 RepID=UPI001C594DE1